MSSTQLSRRAFAAGVACVPALTASAAIAAAPIGGADPIFASIDAHRIAYAEYLTEIRRHSALEVEFMSTAAARAVWKKDPRWIASERKVEERWEAVPDAAISLANVEPTSLAGVAALLNYFAEVLEPRHEDGVFPDCLYDDDVDFTRPQSEWRVVPFASCVSRNAAHAVGKMAMQS